MINELRTNILEELEKIENVAEIYDWIPEKFNGFPSIYFVFDRIESSVSDSNEFSSFYGIII